MAHAPAFDPASTAGQAIIGLFNQIKETAPDPSDEWPGGHTVDLLTNWFGGLGIDVTAGPIQN